MVVFCSTIIPLMVTPPLARSSATCTHCQWWYFASPCGVNDCHFYPLADQRNWIWHFPRSTHTPPTSLASPCSLTSSLTSTTCLPCRRTHPLVTTTTWEPEEEEEGKRTLRNHMAVQKGQRSTQKPRFLWPRLLQTDQQPHPLALWGRRGLVWPSPQWTGLTVLPHRLCLTMWSKRHPSPPSIHTGWNGGSCIPVPGFPCCRVARRWCGTIQGHRDTG